MIIEGQGNLLNSEADALVNTVNTVGVMGRGIALQFRQDFSENFRLYQAACRQGKVHIGEMFITRTTQLTPAYIINFPTKVHWREQARIENIQTGLIDLVVKVKEYGIHSIALPPLGCGLGGLRWEQVRSLIEEAFSVLPDVEVIIFAPGLPLEQQEHVIRTQRPELTLWRASLIRLIEAYGILAFSASHLEAQKLLYFLKASGEDLTTHFVKGDYGPYDVGMKHGLIQMEGHYLLGFGEGRRMDAVHLAPSASQEAHDFLEEYPETEQRIDRVIDLIEGFETPYGLELLASVHWIAHDTESAAQMTEDEIVKRVHQWSERKKKVLTERDLRIAYQRLARQGWL